MQRRTKAASPANSQADADEDLRFRFDHYLLDLPNGSLSRDGERIRIQRKPFQVLAYLISKAPRLVPREELLQRFWSRAVNEEALTRCISTIRKLLQDTEDPPRIIETQRARGYRFIAAVAAESADAGTVQVATPTARRPVGVVLAGALAAGLVVLATLLFQADRATPGEPVAAIERLVVLPISVNSVEDAWLAPVLTDHLMRTIARIEGVSVVTYSRPALPPETSDVTRVGKQVSADGVLVSTLAPLDSGSRLSANLGLSIVGGPLAFALARNGDLTMARTLVGEIEALATERYVPPTKLAVAYLGLNDTERALAQLEEAVQARDDRLVYLSVDVHFRDVIGTPGFEAIASRVTPGPVQ